MISPNVFSPPPNPFDRSLPRFRTSNGAFVAAAIAADLFQYLGCEVLPGSRRDVVFHLLDPHGLCDEYQRRFTAGVFPSVNPSMHNTARGFIKDEITRIRGGKDASK